MTSIRMLAVTVFLFLTEVTSNSIWQMELSFERVQCTFIAHGRVQLSHMNVRICET